MCCSILNHAANSCGRKKKKDSYLPRRGDGPHNQVLLVQELFHRRVRPSGGVVSILAANCQPTYYNPGRPGILSIIYDIHENLRCPCYTSYYTSTETNKSSPSTSLVTRTCNFVEILLRNVTLTRAHTPVAHNRPHSQILRDRTTTRRSRTKLIRSHAANSKPKIAGTLELRVRIERSYLKAGDKNIMIILHTRYFNGLYTNYKYTRNY